MSDIEETKKTWREEHSEMLDRNIERNRAAKMERLLSRAAGLEDDPYSFEAFERRRKSWNARWWRQRINQEGTFGKCRF